MSDPFAERRREWDRLRAERAALRGDLAANLAALEARARDPFGLREKIRRHPVAAAAMAAGAGALLVRVLVPGAPARCDGSHAGRAAPPDESAPLLDALRDALLRAAAPWIRRFVDEYLGGLMAVPDADGHRSSAAPCGAAPPTGTDEPPRVPVA